MKRFQRRGIVLSPGDTELAGWVDRATRARLNVIGLHASPQAVLEFVRSEPGRRFLAEAHQARLDIEYEMHSMSYLMPPEVLEAHPDWMRTEANGEKAGWNFCPSNVEALAFVAARAAKLAEELRPTTNRFYLWPDDARPWCRCSRCAALSDSDQALITAEAILRALRSSNPDAQLAHLAYANTLQPPTRRPPQGIFLEYAPIQRCYEHPLSDKTCQKNREHAETLFALLRVFPAREAHVLEYWLDASMFSGWKRPPVKVPFSRKILRADLEFYAQLGIRSITTFGVFLDPEYVRLHGEPPVVEYGKELWGEA